MNTAASLVERLRPLLADRALGQQLYVVALLESGSAERYRQWAREVADPGIARRLTECAEREDAIAGLVRGHFAAVIEQPPDLPVLAGKIQREVAALFGGHDRDEQFSIQGQAERGGEQFWQDLAAAERDPGTKAVLVECAELEAGSARFLESLNGASSRLE
jgi:hypothetical protein